MKKITIALLALLIALGFAIKSCEACTDGHTPSIAEGELTFSATASSFVYEIENNDVVEKSYGIYSTNRDELIRVIRDFWGYPIVIEIDEVGEMTWNSHEDIPMGNVYAKQGRWFVYYEQNKGYMDLWR